jgi:hypothetical protein
LLPAGKEKAIRIPWVARADWGDGDAVALVFYNEMEQEIDRRPLPFRKYWTGESWWRGQDASGRDVEGLIRVVVEATIDGVVLQSAPHEITRLIRLPDPGPNAGYVHPVGTDRKGTDDWGRPHVIEALVNTASEWPHRERPIAYMDISLQNGGKFEPHHYHQHGECVDIRYVRRDPGVAPLTFDTDSGSYDREATQQLIDLLIRHGAQEIWADARAGLQGEQIVRVGGHADHFHAVFALDSYRSLAVNEQYIGGDCLDQTDCDYLYSRCLVQPGQTFGVCTRACTTGCESRDGGRYTGTECVPTREGNLCLPAQDQRLQEGCGTNLWPRAVPNARGQTVEVCLPWVD